MSSCLTMKKSNCKNCYKCIRHCPVKSIRFSGNQAHIIDQECVLCGTCFVVCPQNAKQIVDETEKAKTLLQGGDPVLASLAPSFIANYPGVGIESMREALKKLGFYDVEETALGATQVKREYEQLLKDEDRDVVISSCCHSINLLIQKHFPKVLEHLADVVSPMQAHCMDIKRRMPTAKTVFIGPCLAKKDEAEQCDGAVDAALTFEELTAWLKAEGIEPKQELRAEENSRARFFPTTGGILKTMTCDAPGYTYMALDGIENCIMALKDIEQGKIHHCFIEMSACSGSCIGGPVMEKYRHSPVRDYMSVVAFAGDRDFEIAQPEHGVLRRPFEPVGYRASMPSETEIKEILREMGKSRPDQELNCSSCGYSTCREKALAIYQGKAEISMCLPYLMDRTEKMTDAISRNSPNGILMLNDKLEVHLINPAMLKFLHLREAGDVLGEPVIRILDPMPFIKVQDSHRGIFNERVYLAEYDRYVEQTIVPAEGGRMILCIMRDVDAEEHARRTKEEISRQTIEVADKVVEKQMRIVQEIASLLGETAAETKIALSKLKESISNE